MKNQMEFQIESELGITTYRSYMGFKLLKAFELQHLGSNVDEGKLTPSCIPYTMPYTPRSTGCFVVLSGAKLPLSIPNERLFR